MVLKLHLIPHMDALTSEFITTVNGQVHPNSIIHPTSIAYIQTLLKPYAEVMESAPLEALNQWITLAFPKELAHHAQSEFVRAMVKKTEDLTGTPATVENVTDYPEVLAAGKIAIIEYLIAEILDAAGFVAGDWTILPWDIQKSIGNDGEFSPLLGIPKGSNQLPVNVVIGPNVFPHMLTCDFTIGLLVFLSKILAGNGFTINMFGEDFTPDYLNDPEHPSRFIFVHEDEDKGSNNYIVTVAGVTYTFETSDFMQGFATGAQWANVDHHLYWNDLMELKREGAEMKRIPLKF